LLIDAGTRATFGVVKARAQQVSNLVLELFVVTHVDSDHVGGAPKLITDRELDLQAREMWFNGREQLERNRLGPVEGEILSEAIKRRGWPLNAQFPQLVVVVPQKGKLPTVQLDAGMTLTLLSPTPAGLAALRPVWLQLVRDAGLLKGEAAALEKAAARRGVTLGDVDVEQLARTATTTDNAPANGSAIAFLAEYEGRSCLFGADAHPDVLVASIRRLLRERNLRRLKLSALKVPHHGSKYNVTQELADLVEASKYLFSSDGTQTQHPDAEAVARILVSHREESELIFNYRTRFNELWDNRLLQSRYSYRARYPKPGTSGIVVELDPC
jgi:beta-lactamase superfamily II metal-dependent hydrolase